MNVLKYKGFTLIELLIVIVVIGVLAAMMMLASTEIVATARANTIISNLRNLKTAALAWFVDNLDSMDTINVGSIRWKTNKGNGQYWDQVKKYMSPTASKEIDNNYSLVSSSQAKSDGKNENTDNTVWFVVYGNDKMEEKVKEKLKARAEAVGLFREAKIDSKYYGWKSSKSDETREYLCA